MNETPCEMCGTVNRVEAPRQREAKNTFVLWLVKPLGRFTQGLTLVACAFTLWAMVLHWVVEFHYLLLLALTWLVVLLIWGLRLIARGAVWFFAPATPRSSFRSFVMLPLCVLVLALLHPLAIPLRIGFLLSQPALEALGRAAPATPPLGAQAPRSAGLYRAKRVDASAQSVRIEVAKMIGTRAGFAKCPQGCIAAKFPPAFAANSQVATYKPLANDWYWWQQDGSDS